MGKVRFTQRCFQEDLQKLPRWAQREAIRIAEAIGVDPTLGTQLDAPLSEFRRVWLRSEYRLLYVYDFPTDTYWIVLIGERRPGKPRDVYEVLRRLVEAGLELK